MISYFIALGFTGCLFLLGWMLAKQHTGGRHFTFFDACGIAALALFSGLRYGIGTDYFLYARIWEVQIDSTSVSRSLASADQEVGFATLAAIAKGAGLSFEGFLLLVAIVTVATATCALWLLSERPRLSILLFVCLGPYLSSMNIVRQGLAAALLLLWFALWKRGRLRIVQWLLVAVAVSMHYSAILVIPLIALVRVFFARRRGLGVKFLVAAATVAVVAGAEWIPAFVELINPRYSTYLGSSESGLGSLMTIAVRVALVMWVIARLRQKGTHGDWATEITLVGLGAVFIALGFVSTPIARLDGYLWPLAAVLIPAVLDQRETSTLEWIVVTLLGIAYFSAYLLSFGGLLPYASIVGPS